MPIYYVTIAPDGETKISSDTGFDNPRAFEAALMLCRKAGFNFLRVTGEIEIYNDNFEFEKVED